MPRGFRWFWWLTMPYWPSYPPWFWWRCRWFPWLPRWWWTGIYGPITPFTGFPVLQKEDEAAILESQKRYIEEELSQIERRLRELKGAG